MNHLQELINSLCPYGVEYKTIGDICYICRGIVMSKDFIRDNAGEYPVYSSQTENNGELGRITTYNFDGEYLTWTTDGANAGSVFYRNGKFSVTNVCGVLEIIDKSISTKFLYYVLQTATKPYVNKGMGNPKLMSNVMARIKIPVPPIEVQCRIVRILDTFTELQLCLQNELTARKKQYEYYRDELLNVEGRIKNVEWKKIEEICEKITSGGTPTASRRDYYNGTIPWLRTQDVDWKDIYSTEIKITEAGLKNSSAKWIRENCVIVAMYGATAAKVAINKIPLTTNQACCNLQINPKIALYRYVFHWLSKEYLSLKKLGQGSQSNINSGIIKSYKIPIPPLEEQARIVAILDRFDKLCNDLSEGIPAEIEARKKQYEYYRDKLLDFPELSSRPK